MVLLSRVYVLQTEQETIVKTRETLAGIHQNVPPLLDLMFRMPYCLGLLEDPSTPQGMAEWYCSISYTTAPYTFHCCYDLYEKGHYAEATILLRSLLENLVQMRFFILHPEKCKGHMMREKGKAVSFSKMFEILSPGFNSVYERYYGNQLSATSHAGICKALFRHEFRRGGNHKIWVGNEYIEKFAGYVINQCVAFLYGYLKLFPHAFPKNILSSRPDVARNLEVGLNWLETWFKADDSSRPKDKEKIFRHIRKLVMHGR